MTLNAFTIGIPDGPNNPSQDQPKMKINNDSIERIIREDHYGFNDNLGGYHNVIHQPEVLANIAPVAILGIGQTYVKTIAGDQELFYKSGGDVETQLTAGPGKVVAAVNFSALGAVIILGNTINVTSVVRNSIGNYTVNFTTALSNAGYFFSICSDATPPSLAGKLGLSSTADFTIGVRNTNTGAFTDPIIVSCVFTL